ncbi:LAGLIDADG family homing endonuclease [Actinomadura geliboluensis]|uniref:LAGLIDADG family homing endonuclease n=1 Tax=Actinomadura geliboluensis TaxID=882440 RepID=UPI003685054B
MTDRLAGVFEEAWMWEHDPGQSECGRAPAAADRGHGADTPILMADGRTKPLRAVRPSDRVYGSRLEGRYRRYVITGVLERRERPGVAVRVTLQDGTRLTVGRDQRLLSDRGWKHPTGAEQGSRRRPHLTLNNSLLGVGAFSPPPRRCAGYRMGYLCGMIRGDGQIGHYPQGRPEKPYAVMHRFRLALADVEALDRARRYLAGFGVTTHEFVFAEAAGPRSRMMAIRAQSAAAVARVEELIRWPARTPGQGWRKGFLAGIFDAEGSCSGGITRISNSDAEILAMINDCLRHFGFRAVNEDPRTHANLPVTVVRLQGGLRERLRFFHLIDPAISRKTSIEGTALKSDAPLGIASITPLPGAVPLYQVVTGTGELVVDGVISESRPPTG